MIRKNSDGILSVIVTKSITETAPVLEAEIKIRPYNGAWIYWNELTRNQLAKCGFPPSSDYNQLLSAIYEAALTELKECSDPELTEASDWAGNVVKLTNRIKNAIRDNEFQNTDISLDTGLDISITPCGYDDPKDFNEVDFYSVHDSIVESGSDLFRIACDILNYDNLQKEQEKAFDMLQEFFEQKIKPLSSISSSEWTEEQRVDWDYYSDWHKDLYGRRPHLNSKDR